MQNDTRTIPIVAIVAVFIVVAVFFFSNQGILSPSSSIANSQSLAVAVPFTKLTQGWQPIIVTRVNYVITSADELNKLWKMIRATTTPPSVDFKTQVVLAVFAGNEPASSITVTKIEDASERMVSIAITTLAESCLKKMERDANAPYEIVAVPATTLPLTHKDAVVTVACP